MEERVIKQLNRLNNRKLRAMRKELVYEAVMTDLYLMGILAKAQVEQLTGHVVSESLVEIREIDRESAA